MKAKYKYQQLLAAIVVFFTIGACTNSALELASTQETADAYYQTDEQVNMALVAAYDPMGWVWRLQQWGGSLKTWGNFASDDAYAGGNDVNDQPTYQAADIYTVSPVDIGFNLESMWRAYFMGNFRANLIIDNVEPDTPYKKSAIAQAKFLKGFYYFYLSRMFGGLPIVDHVPLPDEIIPRSTYDETLTYIETLLEEAIASGDLQIREGMNDPANGLATLASAQALLGKAYLYHKKYDKAIEILKQVDANSNYQLENEYWKVFKGSNKHGIESIFEINFSMSMGGGNEGNSDIYLMGPRGGVTFNDTITSGWGFNQPTQLLVDAFMAENDMVRLHATVLFSDSLQAWYDKTMGKPSPINWVSARDGYWDRKHYPDPNNAVSNAYNRFANNDIILRLADVYLMLAEAYVRSGNNGEALKYVNKVRERARLPLLNTLTLADVKKERRLELALEAERYFDLVRWSGDPDQIDADHVLGPLGYANGTPGTKTKGLFPIPQSEINATYGEHKLVQNEGY
ncbi:MAG: RagB/SusD family nutrient uptake outer membrane protein [Prolixibacteraceae bacterium]|nr:RagB/SusD family nutrient uptake outer membrane protein [Prolixibacteraceae bacterium]